jgi:acyl-coenzyme A thioesterase PaaI-like protein
MPHNHCYGCGPQNPNGLRIKSHWSGEGLSVAEFTPEPYHCAGPEHFVNGGLLATLIDCHCVCTAAAAAYRDAGREIGSKPDFFYATLRLAVEYLRPTPMGETITLEASIIAQTERTYVLSCEARVHGKTRVHAEVEAIRVPETWMTGRRPTA